MGLKVRGDTTGEVSVSLVALESGEVKGEKLNVKWQM